MLHLQDYLFFKLIEQVSRKYYTVIEVTIQTNDMKMLTFKYTDSYLNTPVYNQNKRIFS